MATAVMQRPTGTVARQIPSAARPVRPSARPAPRAHRAPAPCPRRAAASGPRVRMRLTLLARRLLALLITLVVVSVAVWTATALRSEASGDASVVAATVVVGAGETVWDIAADYVPAGETTHGYVARVLRFNDIDAAAVAPGTVLQLPRS